MLNRLISLFTLLFTLTLASAVSAQEAAPACGGLDATRVVLDPMIHTRYFETGDEPSPLANYMTSTEAVQFILDTPEILQILRLECGATVNVRFSIEAGGFYSVQIHVTRPGITDGCQDTMLVTRDGEHYLTPIGRTPLLTLRTAAMLGDLISMQGMQECGP
jgi:hypothetical protein